MKVIERVRIVFVVVLGIIALGLLTWGIGKVYLELVGHTSGAKTGIQGHSIEANTLKDAVLGLPEVKFWTCQVGVFQNESNALMRKEQLTVLGYNAEVITSNPWTVSIGLGHSAEELKGLRQGLIEKGIATVPKQRVLSERSFRVVGNGGQLTAEVLIIAYAILQEGFTSQALEKEKQIWETMAGDNSPKELARLHQLYSQLREEPDKEEQIARGLLLFSESQRVINKFSGK